MRESLYHKPSGRKGSVVIRKPEEIAEMRRSVAFSDHRVSLSNNVGGMPLSNGQASLIGEMLALALQHRRLAPSRARLVSKVINVMAGRTPAGQYFNPA